MNFSEAKLLQIQKNIEACVRELPDQFALSEVKYNLKRALESINTVNAKRKKRKINEMQNESKNKMAFMSLDDAKRALQILDDMMASEQKTIDALNNAPKNSIQDMSDEMLLG